jgi:hypothetical protein
MIKLKTFGNFCDVFYGESGWEPAARFKLNKTKQGVFLEQVLGDPVPGFVKRFVIYTFNPNKGK